jgi:hypothetical protein
MDWFGCTKNRATVRRLESEFAELTRRIAELKRRLHVGEAQPPERIMWSETHGFHDYNDCGPCIEYRITMSAQRLTPTLHPDFEIGIRVKAELGEGVTVTGKITGVSHMHVIFSYIILLDEPLEVPGWKTPWETIVIPGGQLTPIEKKCTCDPQAHLAHVPGCPAIGDL